MEFDIVNNPHPHPLIFQRQGKLDDQEGRFCSKCGEPWHPPAFNCSNSDCNFLLHQSCIDHPSQIHTPFHSHLDKRLLSISDSEIPCHCCDQKPFGKFYKCRDCNFLIDLQCTIVDPKANGLQRTRGTGEQFRYFAHPHPLTLHQQQQRSCVKLVCDVCRLLITSGSTYYFCSQSNCDSYFHRHCAELPCETLFYECHPHSLFLFARPWLANTTCETCSNECTKFFYACPPCNFNLHVDCFYSFNHQHDFVNLRTFLPFECKLCGKKSKDEFPWYCSICHLFAHKSCAIRQTPEEEHLEPSTPTPTSLHSSIGSFVQQENGILHFSHNHNLIISTGEDRHCDGCMRSISKQSKSYGCSHCAFYLHQECANLPRRHKNSLLHAHELNMVYIPNLVFSCAVCLQYCHGFAYQCEECYYAIDIRCVNAISFPFTHLSHPHHLNRYIGTEYVDCSACGQGLWQQEAFGCQGCRFYLDVRCAHLPLAVKNSFDEHPLILTFKGDPLTKRVYVHDKGDQYYCDICENIHIAQNHPVDSHYMSNVTKVGEWQYSCRVCSFFAHPNCVLGDYPFLKSAEFEDHRHPLNLVEKGKKGCGVCGDSCDDKLAFECERCKFNVHAFGLCYHQQLIQSRVTFTMPSLPYRSIPLHLDPDEIKWYKLISLNHKETEAKDDLSPTLSFIPQGTSWWDTEWDDGVFSTIRAFRMYYNGHSITAIQIEYEDKDGNSIWKDMHGGYVKECTMIEVTLNHPDEYLISIHGCICTGFAPGIQSLTFETNQRSLGPYGIENEYKFSFPTKGVKIVGFYGYANGSWLNKIGFHFVKISIPK